MEPHPTSRRALPPCSRGSSPGFPGWFAPLLVLLAALGFLVVPRALAQATGTDPNPTDPAASLAAAAIPAAEPPHVVRTDPTAGATVPALDSIEVFFAAPVLGVDAADLLVDGHPATGVSEGAPGQFVFAFPPATDGPVTFRWAPDHGIVDGSGAGLPFAGGAWTVTVDSALARRSVLITEFMADNDVALYDDDCDRSDWIEIHNTGTTPVNLLNWSLTDDAADPRKWRFPAYTLEAQAYLVVFASQKNKTNLPPRACRTRSNSLAGFHTNFRLDPDGEYLALVAPDGEIISAFAPQYPPQRRDVSYGRVPGAPDLTGYLARPTPRAANAAAGDGFAPDIRFSRTSTPFLDPFHLELTAAAGAQIRYTVDGTFPADTNANLRTYTGPIAITNTTQVRARAFAPGLLPGQPASETYLRLTNDVAQLGSFTSTLPIVVLTTLRTATIGGNGNTTVHFSLFEPRDGRTTLLGPPTLATRAGIKTRGSSTGGQPQSNFAVEGWDEFNQDRDLSVLGMPEDSEWVLYAPNEYDAALIHNPFTMGLSRQMDFAAPRTRFVEVYLNKGGNIRSNDWFGLYVLMEKPGLSKGRIDAPKAAPEDTALPEVTGSYLFKTDRLDPGDTGFSAGGYVNCYVEPKEREMRSPQRAPQLAYLATFFRDLDRALVPTNANFRDPVRGYRGYLEITNWMDFHLLETLSGQVDAIRLSTYFYKRRDGKLEYGPRWDYDRAWESKADGRDDNPRIWDSGGGLFGNPWWGKVFADRDAWQVWIDRWQLHRRTVLSQTNMFAFIDGLTNEIRSAQPRENRRWTQTAPRSNYPNEIRIMKTWISNRLAWIDSQFAPPPRLSSTGAIAVVSPGFELTIQVPPGISNPTNVAVFYTLDGSDPRPSRGTSAPVALRYTGPIRIDANTRVTARLRDNGKSQRSGPPTSSTWSGPVAATFVVTPPALVLTELMFHPEPPPAGSPYSESDFEFLELKNISSAPLDLVGTHFTAGISFRFSPTNAVTRLPPGARLLLVRNLAAFRSRYPDAGPVAGEFEGGLADEGERLALAGPAEEPLFDFTYSDHRHRTTDGLGFALVLADESTPPSQLGDPVRWQAGSLPGGSPGQADPPPAPTPPHILVSEILAAPTGSGDDWIELHNPENQTANVGGWWLTDSLDNPKKIRLPANTVLGAGAYLVIPGRVFNTTAPGGFGLGAGGDGIWLLSADSAGNLTGWLHGFTYGASSPGVTFARHLTAAGAEHFVAQLRPTPGAANVGPLVGPLVISEVALRRSPLGSALGVRDAFIELLNASPTSLRLTADVDPALTWRLRGSVRFDLPGNTVRNLTLAPAQRLVIVGFDPSLDRFELAAFRARHALDDSVILRGPWQGDPDPVTPVLRLLPPGVPDDSDPTPAHPAGVDEVRAVAASPEWPAAGFEPGTSLTRRTPTAFSDDGANWLPARPTPGTADSDTDGLPDAWESTHRLDPNSAFGVNGPDGDPDGDGASNRAEFHNGTDPHDPADRLHLRILASGPGRIACLVDVSPGPGVILETATDPDAATWETLRTETPPAESTVVFHLETRPDAARFYRVRTP